jgi:hypothetical protein
MTAQLEGLPAPALVVLDGESEITDLTHRLSPTTPTHRCWWHLPHGLRKAGDHSRGEDCRRPVLGQKLDNPSHCRYLARDHSLMVVTEAQRNRW